MIRRLYERTLTHLQKQQHGTPLPNLVLAGRTGLITGSAMNAIGDGNETEIGNFFSNVFAYIFFYSVSCFKLHATTSTRALGS